MKYRDWVHYDGLPPVTYRVALEDSWGTLQPLEWKPLWDRTTKNGDKEIAVTLFDQNGTEAVVKFTVSIT